MCCINLYVFWLLQIYLAYLVCVSEIQCFINFLCVLQLLQIYLAYLVCVSEIQCFINLSVCVTVAADLRGIPGLCQ